MSSLSGPFGQCAPAREVAGLSAPGAKRFVTFWGGDYSWLVAAGYRFVRCLGGAPVLPLCSRSSLWPEAGPPTSLSTVVLRRVGWGLCGSLRLREEAQEVVPCAQELAGWV